MRISDWSSDVCSSDLCSLPVAFNGAVTSYSGSRFSTFGNEQGGNIWFYNAGGLLIGDGATFNVGSLLLTTNAIDTTGGLFGPGGAIRFRGAASRSEEHTSELQSLMRNSYAVFCLQKKKTLCQHRHKIIHNTTTTQI